MVEKSLYHINFRRFVKKKYIITKYVASYVHIKNGLTKQKWHIIVTMKDSMLIDSRLSNRF